MQPEAEKSVLSWMIVVFLCLSLGLAPYSPEPHVVEKLRFLINGDLSRPIDMFDLVLHGAPWVVLLGKIILAIKTKVRK